MPEAPKQLVNEQNEVIEADMLLPPEFKSHPSISGAPKAILKYGKQLKDFDFIIIDEEVETLEAIQAKFRFCYEDKLIKFPEARISEDEYRRVLVHGALTSLTPEILFSNTIETHPDLRGQGLGTAVQNRIAKLAISLNHKFLIGHQADEEAVRFFLNRGRFLREEIKDEHQELFETTRNNLKFETIKILNLDDVQKYVKPSRINADTEDRIAYKEKSDSLNRVFRQVERVIKEAKQSDNGKVNIAPAIEIIEELNCLLPRNMRHDTSGLSEDQSDILFKLEIVLRFLKTAKEDLLQLASTKELEIHRELTPVIPSKFQGEFEKRMEVKRKRGTPEAELVDQVMYRWLSIKPGNLTYAYNNANHYFVDGFEGFVYAMAEAGTEDNMPMRLDGQPAENIYIKPKNIDQFLDWQGYKTIDTCLKSKKVNPALSKLLESDREAAISYTKEAYNSSFVGPNGELVRAIFEYKMQKYCSEDLEEDLKVAMEIIRKFGEHGAGMGGYCAKRNLNEVLRWYLSPEPVFYDWLVENAEEAMEGQCDIQAFRKEYLKCIFDKKAQPHLLAYTFAEFVDVGLKPELVTQLLKGPLATHLDETYDMEGRIFSPLGLDAAEKGIAFWKLKEITPEIEAVIMTMIEASRLETLLGTGGQTRVTKLCEGFEEKVDQEYDMDELIEEAKAMLIKMEECQNSPTRNEHCDYTEAIERLKGSLSMAIFKRNFEQTLKPDEKPILGRSQILRNIDFHAAEEADPRFQNAFAALTKSENLEYLLKNNGRAKAANHLFCELNEGTDIHVGFRELTLQTKNLITTLKSYQGDPPPHIEPNIFTQVIQRLEEAWEEASKKRKLRLLINSKIEDSPLANANETTRLIIGGTALMMAIGAIENSNPGTLALPQLSSSNSENLLVLASDHKKKDYWKEIESRIKDALPKVTQFILEQRTATPGLMPIGGKVHVERAVDPQNVKLFQQIFGLDSTPFQLIHAGESMILPPLPSAAEQALLILLLEKIGVIDSKSPQIQTAIAGRWTDETASMVGSAMLLGTRRGVRYKRGAFSTTHDNETGARIMTYDAPVNGVKIEGLPFDIPAATGRTDMLGRQIISDIDMYQVLGTLASHQEFGGPFEREADQFRRAYSELLERHDLKETVGSSAWIFNQERKGDSLEGHEAMIGSISDRWFKGLSIGARGQFGIIGDVRKLVLEASQSMQSRAEEVIQLKPRDYRRLKKY